MTKTESIAHKKLLAEGYQVEKPLKSVFQSRGRFFTHRHDLYGLWDFIAINEKEIRFIQESVKYMSQRPHSDQEAMKAFPCPPNCHKEFWKYDRKKKEHIITIII